MTTIELPEPDASAKAHSEHLQALIVENIQSTGGITSFSDYMNSALYAPGLGYYMAGAAKFGAEGDFITAPEVSPLFGASIAVQLAEALDHCPGAVLELGAGSGKLALSIIKDLAVRADFSYSILEPSAELAQRQKQLLQSNLPEQTMARITWLDTLPPLFSGVVIANEVMDALPVERFRVESQGLQQVCVTPELEFETRPAGDALTRAVSAIEVDLGYALPEGYESEICLQLGPWLQSIADRLKAGLVLLIDYGYPRKEYYSVERSAGTLTCYYRHRAHHDPFFLPGLQDITAHVDFTAVAEAGLACEMELIGYASQSAFLLDNNLLELAETLGHGMVHATERLTLASQIKTLTLPGEMGERFQVMALGKGYDLPLRGFRSQDLAYRL